MDEDYKEMYSKYKKKYLKLKKQLGGNNNLLFRIKANVIYKNYERDLTNEENKKGVGVHYNLGISAQKYNKNRVYNFLIKMEDNKILLEMDPKKTGIIFFESIEFIENNIFEIKYNYKAKTKKGIILFKTKIKLKILSFDNFSDKYLGKSDVKMIDDTLAKLKKDIDKDDKGENELEFVDNDDLDTN